MADDAIFDGPETEPGSSGGSGEGAPGDRGEAAQGTSQQGIDPRQLQQAFVNAVAPLKQEMEQLKQHVAQQAQAGGSQAGNGSGRSAEGGERAVAEGQSTIDRFVEDADSVLAENNQKVLRQIAPVLQGVVSEAQERKVSTEKSRIDERFGEGTFDEKIAPRLKVVLENAGAARMNPDFVSTAVAHIQGSEELQDELFERRQKRMAEKKRAERQRPPQFVGQGRMVAPRGSDEIDEESETFLASLGRQLGSSAGFDSKRFKQVRSAPRNFNERLAWAKENGIPMPGVDVSGSGG